MTNAQTLTCLGINGTHKGMIICLRFKDTNTHCSILNNSAKQQQLLFKVLILMRYKTLTVSENQNTYSGVMVISQYLQNWLPKFRNRNQYLNIGFNSSFFSEVLTTCTTTASNFISLHL